MLKKQIKLILSKMIIINHR